MAAQKASNEKEPTIGNSEQNVKRNSLRLLWVRAADYSWASLDGNSHELTKLSQAVVLNLELTASNPLP